jgi:hypothetical protein
VAGWWVGNALQYCLPDGTINMHGTINMLWDVNDVRAILASNSHLLFACKRECLEELPTWYR